MNGEKHPIREVFNILTLTAIILFPFILLCRLIPALFPITMFVLAVSGFRLMHNAVYDVGQDWTNPCWWLAPAVFIMFSYFGVVTSIDIWKSRSR